MLVPRKLDNQSFEEIVRQAKGRLPWLCPIWTDHNAHDPGITLLELMAWYKELQQYHMDQLTPALQRTLLKLAGIEPALERAADCALEIPSEDPGHLALSRLSNQQEMIFELTEPIPAVRPVLKDIRIRHAGQQIDVSSLINRGTSIRPFAFGHESQSELRLGFARVPENTLRLWFAVKPPSGPKRNPVGRQSELPRTLVWHIEGAGEVHPLRDETWNLSWSGYVTLPVPREWQQSGDGLYWLTLRQLEPGCEETVRISGLSVGRYQAAQQESLARQYLYQMEASPEQQITVATAQSLEAELAVFLRGETGWEQSDRYRAWKTPEGRRLEIDGTGSAQDGEANLLVVCLDPIHLRDLLFDAKGLPEEQIHLNLKGMQALPDHLQLVCQTLEQDGIIRPAFWRRVDDLSVCSPRDRVFVYDAERGIITFGDGAHGSVVAPGTGAIMVTELILSHCGGGNIPANAGLIFDDGNTEIRNFSATGGQNRETLQQARGRLLRQLNQTVKCQTAVDYEQCALLTPGLRMAGAKAIPGFDCDTGNRRRPACITVVVLPATENTQPLPDRRYLTAVKRQLEKYRPVCMVVKVAPPRYVPLAISLQLLATPEAEERIIRRCLAEWFAPRAGMIGRTIRQDDIAALLQKAPGVLQVQRLELQGTDQSSWQTAGGDLNLPPDGLPVLEKWSIELVHM